ncbi:MAG: rRNA maturation RNase YbeY [Polyangiaceae bacterium]
MPVHLVVETRAVVLSSRTITTRATRMLAAVQMQKAELSIVLTGDKQIHKLNKDYRGKDRPTDVLAFAMREGEFGAISPDEARGKVGELLGDVIVSLATAARQARERGVAPLDEVTMLIAHGILHLLGWDHETAAKDRAMRKETDRLVAAATSRPPYKGRKKKTQT